MFDDGREERMEAVLLEMRLKSDPRVKARRDAYNTAVRRARDHAKTMAKDDVIAALMSNTRGYIRELLETEDDRFGAGALAERYARTFWKNFRFEK